jgi:hypothetical protein
MGKARSMNMREIMGAGNKSHKKRNNYVKIMTSNK